MGRWVPVCYGCGGGREFRTIGIWWDDHQRCSVCGADLPKAANGAPQAHSASPEQSASIRAAMFPVPDR